ncbi:DNA repair protein RecO [Clostridium cochlearium]|uniref:DNA repair protein RecO n=1 Tax=Clostridium cochlearium TaxID=1494 RepID=UPI000DCFFCF3|nr:DNA repair protein RecO [Clostridium cochlearium]MBE6064607.1 DNA repair protein RecO [Clostridium cochlearium]MBU5268442.1 DNA repair protein RecO [Clostridium cochlearium]NMA57973.1 DNA repair protein RecO [Clostridium cochlearium]
MSVFNTRALVIKTQDYKEWDKIIWFFTEKLGKISVIAKGAKKNSSKFFSASLPFCYGNYIFYKGKGMHTLNEGEIVESFQDFLSDLDTITYASYFCELIDICFPEGESNRMLFKELITAFYLMKTKAVDLETLARVFELRILKATGYELSLDKCSICKEKITSSNYISLQYLGGVCNNCIKSNGIDISNASYNIIKYLNRLPIEKTYRISIPDNLKKEIYDILKYIISQNYIRKPKSLEILNISKEG